MSPAQPSVCLPSCGGAFNNETFPELPVPGACSPERGAHAVRRRCDTALPWARRALDESSPAIAALDGAALVPGAASNGPQPSALLPSSPRVGGAGPAAALVPGAASGGSARTRRSVRRQRSYPAKRSTAPASSVFLAPSVRRNAPEGGRRGSVRCCSACSLAQRPAAPSLQFPCASVLLRDVPGAALVPAPGEERTPLTRCR